MSCLPEALRQYGESSAWVGTHQTKWLHYKHSNHPYRFIRTFSLAGFEAVSLARLLSYYYYCGERSSAFRNAEDDRGDNTTEKEETTASTVIPCALAMSLHKCLVIVISNTEVYGAKIITKVPSSRFVLSCIGNVVSLEDRVTLGYIRPPPTSHRIAAAAPDRAKKDEVVPSKKKFSSVSRRRLAELIVAGDYPDALFALFDSAGVNPEDESRRGRKEKDTDDDDRLDANSMWTNASMSYQRQTLLQRACREGFSRTVAVLLEFGANPDSTTFSASPAEEDVNDDSSSIYPKPIILAAQNIKPEVIHLLLKYGANPEEPFFYEKEGDEKTRAEYFLTPVQLVCRASRGCAQYDQVKQCLTHLVTEFGASIEGNHPVKNLNCIEATTGRLQMDDPRQRPIEMFHDRGKEKRGAQFSSASSSPLTVVGGDNADDDSSRKMCNLMLRFGAAPVQERKE